MDFGKEPNDKGPKFRVDNHVRILKYKILFAQGQAPNWSKEVFMIKKVKNNVSWAYVISDINGKNNVRTFYE